MAHDTVSGNDEIYRLLKREGELEQQLADCESDYRMQVDKAVELHKEVEQLRAALASLEVYSHYWSTRPCQTCREIGEVLGRPYGCYVKAERTLLPRKERGHDTTTEV